MNGRYETSSGILAMTARRPNGREGLLLNQIPGSSTMSFSPICTRIPHLCSSASIDRVICHSSSRITPPSTYTTHFHANLTRTLYLSCFSSFQNYQECHHTLLSVCLSDDHQQSLAPRSGSGLRVDFAVVNRYRLSRNLLKQFQISLFSWPRLVPSFGA